MIEDSSIIYGRVCSAIGFLGVYTEWTKLLFTMWVTFHFFCFAVLHKNLKKLEVLYVVTSLLVPALIAIVPLVTHAYGLSPDGNICYIYANTSVAFIERLALWDGPAMLMLIAASTAMVVMVTKLTSQVCRRSNSFVRLSFNDLVVYRMANFSGTSISNHAALAVANGVSVLVCLLAAILLCCLKLYKKIVYRLALYQVLSALAMASVGAAMGVVSINSSIIHGRVCTAIGFLGVYTEWTKLLFTMWVTFHLFCFAVLHKNLKKLEVLYVVTSLLVPALIAILPLVTHTYGLNSDGNACYIYANTSVAFIERLALWDGPAMLMLIAASTAMVVMVTKLTSQHVLFVRLENVFAYRRERYSLLVDYLTSCKEGDLRDSRVYPVGATANEKRRIRQQAAMFVLKERLLYYRATDAGNEICLKRVIANVKERTKIIRACHDGVDGCHYGRDKTRAKIGQTYWWKGLNRDVDQYCRQCDVCQRVNAKLEGKKAELHPIPVPSKSFSSGTMVMLKNMQNSHRMEGKLDKKWLGPYEVVESLSKGRYRLKSSDGSILKKAYNSFLLKEYLQPFEDGAQEINNDDDNDDIGDGDDCYCDDDSEDNGDIDDGSSCGQVELMQKVVCLLAAILVLRLKLYKTLVYRLALYQVLSASAMASVGALQVMRFINYDESSHIYHGICTAIGFLEVYTEWTLHDVGDLSSILFCGIPQEYDMLYVVTSLLVPALIAALPLVTQTYG
eukprot:Em0841g1a